MCFYAFLTMLAVDLVVATCYCGSNLWWLVPGGEPDATEDLLDDGAFVVRTTSPLCSASAAHTWFVLAKMNVRAPIEAWYHVYVPAAIYPCCEAWYHGVFPSQNEVALAKIKADLAAGCDDSTDCTDELVVCNGTSVKAELKLPATDSGLSH
jgi:hypothetical protein